MKKSQVALMMACALPLLGGCEGVRFADNAMPTNATPPEELRTVVPAGSYAKDLSTLVGTIAVYNKADKSLQVLEQIADPYDPRTRPVVEVVNKTIYSSLIDQNMQTDVPILADAKKAAGAESLTATVVDEAHAMVPKYYVDMLAFYGSKYRPTNPQEEIVYVADAWLRHFNAALLTHTNVNARAAGTTPVVGYNGKVYTKADNFKDAEYLSVGIVPYAQIMSMKPGDTLSPMPAGAVASIKPMSMAPQAYFVPMGDWRRHHCGWRHDCGDYYRTAPRK